MIDQPIPSARETDTAARTAVPSVFISATIDDLKPYRDAVRGAADRAEFVPVLSDYSPESRHELPLSQHLERAAQPDVVVVIVGHRYGWVSPDPSHETGPSMTVPAASVICEAKILLTTTFTCTAAAPSTAGPISRST